MNPSLLLLAGIAFAAGGGELFVRGIVGVARSLRVSPGVVATTLAAFATSTPELTVSVAAALAGTPQIALGDALGSNVVNVALILGLVVAISPMRAARGAVKRDFAVALAVPVFTAIAFVDGVLSRPEAFAMFVAFVAWLAAIALEARHQRGRDVPVVTGGSGLAVAQCAAGLLVLVFAARLIVSGATGIAEALGVAPFAIGATLVALGTSAPEVATAVVAKVHGHDDVSVGTILGSNIFNGLFIVGIAAGIHPIAMGLGGLSIALGFGIGAMVVVFPPRSGAIPRSRGAWLLATYAAYILAIAAFEAVPEWRPSLSGRFRP